MGNPALARDQEADLPFDFSGKCGYLTRQLGGNDVRWIDLSSVEILKSFLLTWFDAARFTVNPVDCSIPLYLYWHNGHTSVLRMRAWESFSEVVQLMVSSSIWSLKRVNSFKKVNLKNPVGPFRCLAIIISAIFLFSSDVAW